MRTSLFLLLSIATFTTKAQKIEKYYDYEWKECDVSAARFYGIIKKTDSGWHRQDYYVHDFILQMDGTYEDSACKIPNGRFYYFYPDKSVSIYGHYVHGKRQGLCESFNRNGMLSDSAVFDNDMPVGTRMGWYANGYPSDSSTWQKDGSGVEITWFDNGAPSSAGRYINFDKRHGKWQFFHPNGKISAIELYDRGTLVNKQYFDEAGNPMDTTNNDRAAEFTGGPKAWQKYLENKLFFPPQFKISNADKAVNVVTFTIDENGKVQDAYVSTPFYPPFDQIALNVVNKSPLWKPAIQHNRQVRYTFKQAVTFSQEGQ